nr:exopolysaccharide biosynthesis protein [uncultured Halomonas sp.]
MAERMALTGLLEQLDAADTGRKIRLRDIVDIFESRGFGPLLVIPALIVLLPTGAVPGVPTLCGLFIAMVAVQLVLGKRSPWLPRRLSKRGFSHDKLHQGVMRVRPWTQRFDRLLKPRLPMLINALAQRLIALLTVLLALAMIPLELLPFASAIPALAIVLMGLGLTAGDGLLTLVGLLVVVAGAIVIWQWLL